VSTPDDQNVDRTNVERGQVVPPWKRGEKTSSTGLTAGEMAKAAGVDTGSRPAVGSASRGGSPLPGPSAPAPSGPAPKAPSPQPPSSPNVPSGPPKPPQGSSTGPARQSGPGPQGPPKAGPQGPPKPAANPLAPGPQNTPSPGAAAETSKFVESETRNIPRNELAKKDELPDLDAIHHVEASKEAATAARAQSQTIPSRTVGVPLRAAVQVRRVDPWSVFKVTGVLSIAGFFIWMIAIAVLYAVLAGMGLWDQINNSFASVVEGDSGGALISTGMVFGFAAGFGVVAAVLLTGLSTISAYIYNVCADMVGGVEVTLADLD